MIQTRPFQRNLIALFFLLTIPSLACATTYYVDGRTGSDLNDGSNSHPWKTISQALVTGPGQPVNTDTISISYATYNESLDFTPLPKRSLILKGIAQDGQLPKIIATGSDHAIDLINFNGTIQGLDISGAPENGINITGDSLNAQIADCILHDNKKGIHVTDDSTPLLYNNIIYDNSECGIGNMKNSAARIDSNEIYHNGSGSASGPSAGICIPEDSSPKIYNNIIRNNYNSGITILNNATPLIINNIIAHHNGTTLSTGIKVTHAFGSRIESVELHNNIFYSNDNGLFSQERLAVNGNTSNCYWHNDIDFFGFTAGDHEIFTDPLFADQYRLQNSSPCIDAGTNVNAPDHDKEGTARPQGHGIDIGAYEALQSGTISPIIFLMLR